MRSPGCGSPETSSTRSLSRTPSMVTTALLLIAVSSPGSVATSSSKMLSPAWSIGARDVESSRRCARRSVASALPSRLTVTVAGSPWSALSSTRTPIVWFLPTMPKRGASTSSSRRSRSPVVAGDRARAAARGSRAPSTLAGMSWTTPSVIRIAPPMRSGGVSASALRSAANSSVPLLSGSSRGLSTKCASTLSIAPSCLATSARAASVCAARSPMRLEPERSTTTATTSFSGRRSSRLQRGIGEREQQQRGDDGAHEAPRAGASRRSAPRRARRRRPARHRATAARAARG